MYKTIKALSIAIIAGPIFSLLVSLSPIFIFGIITNTSSLESTLLFLIFGSFIAYPATVIFGVPAALLYERFVYLERNYKKVWPFIIIGWFFGSLISLFSTMEPAGYFLLTLTSVICAYSTAKIYFFIKYRSETE